MTKTQDSADSQAGVFGLGVALEFGLFVLFALLAALEPTLLLRDPGTGWHIVTGSMILETGQIPNVDEFSFTATGNEWASLSWLFQLLAAGLVAIGGLPLLSATAALGFAVVPVLLFRRMVRMGVGALPALFFGVVALIVLQAHALARPHVLTYVFFALILDRLDRFQAGALTARQLWWIPLLVVIWCNFHGGFTIGPVLAGLYVFATGAQFLWSGSEQDKQRTIVLAGLTAAMVVASMVNPAGPWLHLSILDYVGMESTAQFGEWQGLVFTSQYIPLVFEGLVLAFIVLLIAGARLTWTDGFLVIVFLHLALHAVRHTSLFVIVAIPILARECLRTAERYRPALGEILWRDAEPIPALKSRIALYGSFCAIFLSLAGMGALSFPDDLDDIHLSAEAAAFIEAQPERFRRPFNSDALAGSLIYRFWPDLHVFVDDRNPVYGDRFVLDEYLRVQRAEPGWQAVLEERDIQTAIVSSRTPVAEILDVSPDWEVVHEDPMNLIFFKTGTDGAQSAHSGASTEELLGAGAAVRAEPFQ